MAKKKINVDIEDIKRQLKKIGYNISSCVEKNNNGKLWDINFKNRRAIVKIYDTGEVVVDGKVNADEKQNIKEIISLLISKEREIHKLNNKIVELIKRGKENTFYDYKRSYSGKTEDLIHDILCLSNNLDNKEAYLIYGVNDDGSPVEEGEKNDKAKLPVFIESHNLFDILKKVKFAGDNMPKIEVEDMYYLHTKIQVIICRKSKRVPFYLSEDYGKEGNKVRANHIYTRVGDSNRGKDTFANYKEVEKLWRIHFGVNKRTKWFVEHKVKSVV